MMHYLKKTWIPVLIVLMVIIFAILKNSSNVPDHVKIGVISPLSGLIANGDNLGQGFANGAILAYEEYLKKNTGPTVELLIEDDGYDSKKGLSAYKKLISVNNIDSLINLSSPTIDVIKDDIHQKGIPTLQLGAESEITADTIFQTYPDQTSIKMLGDIANSENTKEVTVVMEQVKAYEKFISDFQANFKGTTKIVRIPSTEKDYRSFALKVKANDSDAVVFFCSPVIGAQILNQMSILKYTPKLYFDISLQFGLTDYIKTLGSKIGVLENAKALYSVSKVDEDFTTKYKARFNAEPGMLTGYGYDSFKIMTETYNKDKATWLANIQKYTGEGVTGAISFNSLGLRPPEFKIATFKDGKLITQ